MNGENCGIFGSEDFQSAQGVNYWQHLDWTTNDNGLVIMMMVRDFDCEGYYWGNHSKLIIMNIIIIIYIVNIIQWYQCSGCWFMVLGEYIRRYWLILCGTGSVKGFYGFIYWKNGDLVRSGVTDVSPTDTLWKIVLLSSWEVGVELS